MKKRKLKPFVVSMMYVLSIAMLVGSVYVIEGLIQQRVLQVNEVDEVNTIEEEEEYLYKNAREVADSIYGKSVFLRGLIEFSNYCKNDCLYCGIRRSNKNIERYRIGIDEIVSCADKGYALGFRTIVLHWPKSK